MSSFSQITPRLPVSNLQRTIDFYVEHIGFETEVLWPSKSPTFAILSRNGTSLSFFEFTEHRTGRIGYAELYIHVNWLLKLHNSLKKQLPIEWGPEIYSYGRQEFAVRDPDDYLIIFTEPTEKPPTTDEPDNIK